LTAEEAAWLGQPKLAGRTAWAAAPEGCAECLGGYKGRTGIHELLAVTPAVAEAVRLNVPPAELRRLAEAAGFRDMLADGVDKILAGVTSAAEVLRAAGAHRD
jgi:type II secretory ATPase GspE/PulE/Tfp pilus assembly ATPase PilB-like protein